jgi:hypothetical protein
MGASGAAGTNAADSYILNEKATTIITIFGGKAGSSSTGGTGGNGGGVSYGVNNGGKYTAYA